LEILPVKIEAGLIVIQMRSKVPTEKKNKDLNKNIVCYLCSTKSCN